MQSSFFRQSIDTLTRNNRVLGIGLVAMVIWNLANTIANVSIRHAQTTVVIPIGSVGSSDLWIGNGTASDAYIKAVSRTIVGALGTYNVGTIRAQLQDILPLFAPDKVGAAQSSFTQLADELEKYPSVSTVAHLAGADPIKWRENVIQAHTNKDRYVNGRLTATTSVFYCIEYRIEGARFVLNGVAEKEGNNADLCFNTPDTRISK